VIFGALIGAITWNLVTWYYGIPVEFLACADRRHDRRRDGQGGIRPAGGIRHHQDRALHRRLAGAGHADRRTADAGVSWICFRIAPAKLDRWFRRTQLLTSALYSIGHGSNDAQKTMGIIWLLLMSHGLAGKEHLPEWVIVSCYLAIAIGTLMGGWRIIRTMGQKLTKLSPASGSAASAGGAVTLFIASHAGIPVSTTHTITGAILGAGAVQNPSRVRWGLATNLVYAWLLTIPASGLVAAAAWWVGSHFIR
jgi:PiT family inorganic phosphate transporter